MYVLFQLIILRPHPHFTRHVRKKNPQNHPHFTRLKIHRSADPHFTEGCKHRLSLYNAYYHNWQTLNFTASDSSLDDRCFLKVLTVLQLMQLAGGPYKPHTGQCMNMHRPYWPHRLYTVYMAILCTKQGAVMFGRCMFIHWPVRLVRGLYRPLAGSKFQSSVTLFENAYFITFSLNLFLNSFLLCPLLSPSSSWNK